MCILQCLGYCLKSYVRVLTQSNTLTIAREKAAKALKEKGETPEELLRSIKENEKAVAEAEKEVAAWKAIVGEKARREEAAKAEAERIATEKAEAERKAAEERERAEKEEEARVEAEKKEAERIAAEKAEEEARVEAERKAEEERIAKQKTEEKTAEAESDKEEAEKRMDDEEPKPLGSGVFGNIYNQFKGKVKEAFDFLMKHKGGDLLGVFHRKDVGDIDLVWGDENGGLAHILNKHVGEGKSFANVDEAMSHIQNIIETGKNDFEDGDKIVFRKGSELVTVRKNFREGGKKIADKNWVLTAYDKEAADNGNRVTTKVIEGKATPHTASIDKGSEKPEKKQEKEQGKKDVVDVDNPQSWVGHTFTGISSIFKGQQFVCEGLDGDKAVFHLKTADDDFKFSITKMRDMFARGWLRVENADLKRGNESVFDIASAIAKNEEKEAAERQERMDGYTADMPPMRRARVRKTLGKELNYRNFGLMTEGEFVESMVAAGGIVTADFHNGKMRRLIDINDGELGHLKYPVSKAAADYAVYLGAKVNESELVNAKTEARMHEIRRKYADEDERGMFDNEEWLDREIGNSSRDKRKQERYEDLTEYKKLKEERDAKFNAHLRELEKKQKKQSVFDKAKEIADKEEKKRKAEAEKPKQKPLTEAERKDAEEVAGALGYRVEWVDTMAENGTIDADKKVIRIAKDAENPLVQVLGHEVAHGVKRMDGGKFKALQKAAKEVVGEKEWNERIEKKRKLNAYAEGKLAEEVTCDIVGEALNDKDALKRLAESLRGERGILARLRDAVAKMVEYFKNRGDKEGVRRMKAADKLLAEFEGALKEDVASGQANTEGVDRSVRESGDEPENKRRKDFAERFGVDESYVSDYANGMAQKNTGKAARARRSMERQIYLANAGKTSKLSDIAKSLKPFRAALKEAFGDLDALIDEYRKLFEEERNMMEAARKKAEEEAVARKRHLDELSLLTDGQIDSRYAEALEKGDETEAREMLDEVARRKGYGDENNEYRMQHRAPSNPGYESDEARRNDIENGPDVNLEDIALGYNRQPDDYFTNPRGYGNDTPHGRESTDAVANALSSIRQGGRDVTVKVYRAVPTTMKEGKLRNGDWVTLSRRYAEMHGNHALNGKYRIMEDEVPAKDIWWDGNDVNEFGYDNGEDYKYKNVKNNRKSDDLVTRDDKGNVIPPSKRFNQRKADERYSRRESKALTAEERELRDNLVERMRKGGLDVVTDSEEMQRVIDTENERTRESRKRRSAVAEERLRVGNTIDEAMAAATHLTKEEARAMRREWERKFKEETKELYGRVLSGNFDDVTLRLIDEFIDKSTPNNPYGRPLSKRLPPRVGQKMRGGERTGSIDALFSRISESAVGKDGKALPRAERERAIEEKKKELLKKWAIATGNWHTDIADFTDQREPIGSGTDSDVYLGKDGKSVIKVSKGKPYGKRFRPDVDNVALFNSVFRNSAYTIVGYGEVDGKFVRFLKQPIVDFTSSTPLTEGERVAYMEKLGFKPINKENTAFSNGEIIASDLQKSNIVKDKQGNVRVIDADMKLHTKDFGGKFSYPDAETDTRTDGVQRFLRTADGEVYGLVKDGRIYLDPKVATAETAVHEYTHLWGDMLRRKDSEQWSHTVKELKNSVLWEEVKELYPELKTDDEIADEVLSTFSGRRGAERLREEARRVADGEGGVFTKAKAIEALERVKEAIARFWEGVARMFGINRYRSVEELADMAMKDLLDSKNPMKDESGMRKRGEVGETLATSGTYFSGGGLLEAGLKGVIDPKVAVEFSEKIAGVYADNHGNHIVVADVRDVDHKKLVGAVDGGEVQYFHASPVCKNFSKAKREGGEVELDKETALSTAEFIAKTRPKVVTIENVKGYRNSEALKIITDELTRQGYDWDADVYNAADYGGYTKRERLIVRAKRDGKLPPKPEKLPEELRKKGWYSAVEDLIPHLEEKKTGVPQGTDERLKNSGIDYRTIDKPLYVFGRGYANKTVGHAFADELLPTLTTGGGDIIIMPDGRVLKASPRVLARVTGLPDTYKMPETDQLSHTIVGNGIPTQLTEGVIAPLLDNAIPSAERATKRESVFDVADRVSQNLEERTRAMGSRVEKRMADVAQKLEGREFTAEQKAVVDVFSGKSDNQKFSVEREDGKKVSVVVRKGTETSAGTKHSLYRHYNTNVGTITTDDILLIPQIIKEGEIKRIRKGNEQYVEYTQKIGDKKLTTLMQIVNGKEVFNNFYSNKKGSELPASRNAESIDNTPEGAHNINSEPSAKVEDKSESPKLFGEEIIDDGKKGSDSIERSVRENPKNEDKPRFSRKPGESIFDYASRVSEDVDRSVRERVSARDEYEKKVKSKGFQTKEALQNSMLGLQEFMYAIDHASGNKRYIEDIPDFENPILGENRLSSVNKEEMHQVAKTQFKPLMSAVAKLSGNGKESGELYDYMFAKHGLERDAVMRQREAQKDFDKYQKANPKGTKTIGDFVASLEGKDYAGLTALTAEDGRVKSIQSQIDAIDEQMKATDDQLLLRKLGGQKKRLKVDLLNAARDAADDIRKTFENNPSHDRSDINELWSRVNEVNGNTLRKLYESGMLTKEAYNDISSMYTNYIPMRGFDQTTSADAYAYLTHGDSAFNAPIKTAKGRSSKADNPIAYMQAMAESAIMQGNRNVLVKQKMLNFVRNHPSDLASISDVWLQYDSVADEWKPFYGFGRESKG